MLPIQWRGHSCEFLSIRAKFVQNFDSTQMVSLLCSRKARVLGGEIPSEIRKMGSVEEVQKFDEIAKQPMSEGDNSAKSTDPKLSFMTCQTRLVESWKMHTKVGTKLHFMKAPTKMNEKVICFSSLQLLQQLQPSISYYSSQGLQLLHNTIFFSL